MFLGCFPDMQALAYILYLIPLICMKSHWSNWLMHAFKHQGTRQDTAYLI